MTLPAADAQGEATDPSPGETSPQADPGGPPAGDRPHAHPALPRGAASSEIRGANAPTAPARPPWAAAEADPGPHPAGGRVRPYLPHREHPRGRRSAQGGRDRFAQRHRRPPLAPSRPPPPAPRPRPHARPRRPPAPPDPPAAGTRPRPRPLPATAPRALPPVGRAERRPRRGGAARASPRPPHRARELRQRRHRPQGRTFSFFSL
ncbi:PREDICTED: basic proline-rich protein-like [Sturnus vulgaris]|uniref:basic proline-rich protein-like n=1 Tax=Sturnus vulgaris TaxID=9172 RepID=UPI00071A559C|nr:PREDICTED: basic proline-rich protein-like [Sturnus vulgaris]